MIGGRVGLPEGVVVGAGAKGSCEELNSGCDMSCERRMEEGLVLGANGGLVAAVVGGSSGMDDW